jgi:hypothetical protein
LSERFLTISASYIPKNECWLIISDYTWYNINEIQIETWAEQCLTDGLVRDGTLLKFVNDAEQNLFLMRWANG